uniref:Uncharacterized protein n=1 Tax=Cyprinodon variegatus TaxID=28743 RepID=A0A3Q2CYZ8_CYPVA
PNSATHPDVHPGGPPLLNTNHNVNKKSALKAVMEQGPNISFYTPILTLVDISLCLHVAVGILFIFTDKETGRWNLIYQPNHSNLPRIQKCFSGDIFYLLFC